MKNLLFITACAFMLAVSAFAQEKDAKQRTDMFKQEVARRIGSSFRRKAGFVFCGLLTMKRMMNTIVVFLVKSEMEGNIEYTKNIGGCSKHMSRPPTALPRRPGESH